MLEQGSLIRILCSWSTGNEIRLEDKQSVTQSGCVCSLAFVPDWVNRENSQHIHRDGCRPFTSSGARICLPAINPPRYPVSFLSVCHLWYAHCNCPFVVWRWRHGVGYYVCKKPYRSWEAIQYEWVEFQSSPSRSFPAAHDVRAAILIDAIYPPYIER